MPFCGTAVTAAPALAMMIRRVPFPGDQAMFNEAPLILGKDRLDVGIVGGVAIPCNADNIPTNKM